VYIKSRKGKNHWYLLVLVEKAINMKAKWSKLNHLQLGKYAEYLVKMAFTGAGLDVYTAEVDDKGIDFVIRKSKKEYYDVQVKSIRKAQYVYMTKETFRPRKNLLLALVIFDADDQEPALLLIPSLDWLDKAHPCLKDYDYREGKSKPEFGIRITKSNAEGIKAIYSFDKRVVEL
jgi:hypothetical protein